MDKAITKKLNLLTKLQTIDSKLDAIDRLKGELPEEVQDLEDGLIGLGTRLSRIQDEISELSEESAQHKADSAQADQLVRKYTDQQKGIRNSREFDAISKEIDLQKLEVKLLEKKLKSTNAIIKEKKEAIKETNVLISKQNEDITIKKEELDQIINENEAQEKKFEGEREKISNQLESQILYSYNRLRENMRNKLSVVNVSRGACRGCFNVVTPQREVDIKAQNKIIICEHCGRILAGVDEVEEVVEVKKKSETKKKKVKSK